MPTQARYQIEGMTRWSNAEAVAGRLSALPRVRDVRMDIVAGTALITSDEALPLEEVHAAVAEAGHALVTPPHGVQDGSRVGLGILIGGLAAALVAGFALAKVISPAEAAPVAEPVPSPGAHPHGQTGDVGGLSISASGYTLVPRASGLSFVVNDAQGKAVTRFATMHEKLMHVVLVRRDLTGYQHVHPVMAPDGVWTIPAALTGSGPWRVFADFTVINASYAQIPVTLGYDLLAGGDFQPRSLPAPAPAREAMAGNTTVTYEGTPRAGVMVPLLFRVFANGSPVTDLEPYLGSFGHLVVLRDGDLGYIHVHPEPKLSGGAVKVWLTAPNPGVYRMFFDFQIHGQVRTAEYTLSVESV